MATMPAPWPVKDLVAAINKEHDSRVIELPRFQRSLEWTDEQRSNLITSLIKGYPIGAPILYLDTLAGKHSGKSTYLLVDGLQRLSTLVWYQEAPLERFSLDAIPSDRLDEFHRVVVKATPNVVDSAAVDEQLVAWLRELKVVTEDFDGSTLIDLLEARLECPPTSEVKAASKMIISVIRGLVDLDDQIIPVLEYSGDRDSLPAVFRGLNRGGTQLSQYDILNAMWSSNWTRITRTDIVTAIRARYRMVEDAGFTVVERNGERYNLYEYLLGLGKYALSESTIKNIGVLVAKRRRDDQADSLVFSIAGVVHGLRPSSLGGLPEAFPKTTDRTELDPQSFETAFIEALRWTVDTLSPYLILDFKGARGAVAHTDFQIASFIARALVGMYDPRNWSKRPEWASEKKALGKSVPRHYLLDVLNREWAGSGDSRLFNMVWEKTGEDERRWPYLTPSSHYLQPVSNEALGVALEMYLESSIRAVDTKRRGASVVDRLLLKLAYRKKLSAEAYSQPFEIEHLMPLSLLQKVRELDPDRPGWPMNSVANLAVLDKKTNREKSSKTLAEYVHTRPRERQRLEQFVFLDLDDIKFPYGGPNVAPERTWDNYVLFLRNNFAQMKEAIIAAL